MTWILDKQATVIGCHLMGPSVVAVYHEEHDPLFSSDDRIQFDASKMRIEFATGHTIELWCSEWGALEKAED